MAELADALASGASRGNPVKVQVLLSALFLNNAGMAQLVEQRIRNAQVVGSSPTTSSRNGRNIDVFSL